jgi:hypothetical protein
MTSKQLVAQGHEQFVVREWSRATGVPSLEREAKAKSRWRLMRKGDD